VVGLNGRLLKIKAVTRGALKATNKLVNKPGSINHLIRSVRQQLYGTK
jgi:hypothetical protein